MRKWRYLVSIIVISALLLGGGITASVSAAPAEWSVPMTATTATEGSNTELEFGVRVGATDGYDSGIDIPHPPPILPLNAYFSIAPDTFDQLDKDFRGEAASIQWTLNVSSSAEAITLTWDDSGVPVNVSLRLTDTGIDIDMRAQGGTVLEAGSHSLTITATTMPDLVVSKSVIIDDGSFTVDYTVTNQGGGPAVASTTCKYIDDVLMATQPCPPLASGEFHIGSFDPEPCPCGQTLTVTICADNYDAVAESDETNNCEVNEVVCPGVPDLVVEKSVTIEDGTFIVSYTVTNQGCGPAVESTTCKYIDGEPMANQPCPALASGQSYIGSFDPEPCPCSQTITVIICADNYDDVAESDETNNCEENIVECFPPTGICCSDPDVTVTAQGVTDDPEGDPGTYDPANMPADATWEDAKGLYIEATGPDGCYQFFISFETPVETGFTLYKLPAWTEVAYTIVGPNTIQVELCISGGVLDPPFVLTGTHVPVVGGDVYPVNKVAVLAPWLALVAAVIAGATIYFRRRRARG